MAEKAKTELRLYREGDEEKLARFHEEVFKTKRPPEYFRWKYVENPEKRAVVSLAFKDEAVVGEICSVGTSVKVGEHDVPGGHIVDIAIGENNRSGGTFFRLERTLRKEDYKTSLMEFAFSIKTTHKLATRLLGFEGASPIYRMVKILDAAPYVEAKIGFRPLARALTAICNAGLRVLDQFRGQRGHPGVIIEEVTRFDERFDELWQRGRLQYEIMIARTSAYLNWRFADHPTVAYTTYAAVSEGAVKGYVVLSIRRKGEASGTIVDIEVDTDRGFVADIFVEPGPDHEGVTSALIKKAADHSRSKGADTVACWVLEHMDLCDSLKALGFFRRETPHDLIVRAGDDEKITNEYLSDPTRWYIARGDSDYE
jgi:GNAT superfamily N-acetyltransferase